MSCAKPKILVAMSGGVDSAVAALRLQHDGFDVHGAFIWRGRFSDPAAGPAPADAAEMDSRDARLAAEALGIPFHVLNLEDDFGALIDRFCRDYGAGRTPNPCVRCNPAIKFGRLLELADRIGAERLATGHYARIGNSGARHLLLRARDAAKDQSYVLCMLSQQQLARAVFPNGDFTKPETRRLASEAGLPAKDKPESQEICFVPGNDYARLIRAVSPGSLRPGPVLDLDGKRIGEHPGIQLFTIGQRHGLRIAFGRPMYVVRLDAAANAVVVGPADALLRRELTASGVNWIVEPPREPLRAAVKIRYRQAALPATVRPLPDGRASVEFDEPARAVAPGQAAVFCLDDVVAGGGWID